MLLKRICLLVLLPLTQTENLRPAYDQLYFVGGMNDWGFVPMKKDVLDPFLFRYARLFDAGQGWGI